MFERSTGNTRKVHRMYKLFEFLTIYVFYLYFDSLELFTFRYWHGTIVIFRGLNWRPGVNALSLRQLGLILCTRAQILILI